VLICALLVCIIISMVASKLLSFLYSHDDDKNSMAGSSARTDTQIQQPRRSYSCRGSIICRLLLLIFSPYHGLLVLPTPLASSSLLLGASTRPSIIIVVGSVGGEKTTTISHSQYAEFEP
jgi:hypothetical protein